MTNDTEAFMDLERALATCMVQIVNEIQATTGNRSMASGITCAMGMRCVAMLLCAFKHLPHPDIPKVVNVLSDRGMEAALMEIESLARQRLEAN